MVRDKVAHMLESRPTQGELQSRNILRENEGVAASVLNSKVQLEKSILYKGISQKG